MFCFDALERAPDFIHQLLEEFGAGLGIEFVPAGGDVEADQEREDRIDREDVKIDQFGRFVPAKPVEQFLALEKVVQLENDGCLVEFRKRFLHRFSFQMCYLGQAQLPVKGEPAGEETAARLADVTVEMGIQMFSFHTELQPVNQFSVFFRQLALYLGNYGLLVERMPFKIEQQVGEAGDDIWVVGHYFPKRIFLVAGRRYSPIRPVKSSLVKLSW